MPGPTTEVLSDDLRSPSSDLHRLEVGTATSFGRIETAIGKLAAEFALFKWLVGAALLASVSGVISSAYWAGSLASRVTTLESRSDKTDTRLDRIEASLGTMNGRLERIEANLGSMDSRLARIEASIVKAAGRGEGAAPAVPEKP